MARIAYVNGRYMPLAEASVHVEDRGFQFADGVYEVITVIGGRPVDEELHFRRLARSLGELRIAQPVSNAVLRHAMGELMRRNRLSEGVVYLQITRGAAPRDHAFPKRARPTVVMTARRFRAPDPSAVERGVGVVTVPDIRWRRCDIKSVSLLPNVLGKQAAKEAGAYEAWQVRDDGEITEGTSSNAWIVTRAGALVTRPADHAILNGVTRVTVLRLARAAGLAVEERGFSVAEALAAAEAFVTSTTAFVLPVVTIDGKSVGEGAPGPFTRALLDHYRAHVAASNAS
jgi:D-alanine transaminase